MYYLQSRYYNPEWGRFLNSDVYTSTGQGILGNNMFAYCNNNPVNCSDPGGFCTLCLGNGVDDQFALASNCSGGGSGSGRATASASRVAVGSAVAVVSVAIAPEIGRIANEVAQALSRIAADVYEYARSLTDYSLSMYDDRQPRVHHVIPKGDFSRYGDATTAQLKYMHALLTAAKIGIDDPRNLVVLSHGTHKSMHTKEYIHAIYNIMLKANPENPNSVEWALFFARIYASSLDPYSVGY